MIKNIIFDFDGVIVDSEVLIAKSLTKYLAKKNISFSEKEFFELAGNKTTQVVAKLASRFNIEDEQLFIDDIMSIANNLYSNELQSVRGAANFLKIINQNKFIASNNIKNRIVEGLKKVGLDNYFPISSIFSFDIVGIPKPEPDIYLKLIDVAGIKKKETIVIEDSAIGTQAGVAAGIKVIGLTAGGHWYEERSTKELYDAGAYEVVSNYKDMISLVNKL